MKIALYVIAAWYLLLGVGSIALIGKPRQPTTPGHAAVFALMDAAIIAVLIIAAGRLS